jgi:hypothetical protein
MVSMSGYPTAKLQDASKEDVRKHLSKPIQRCLST